ncbi:MAG: cell division protein FtsQ/DivIB [Verrucomicrobiota bacterium]
MKPAPAKPAEAPGRSWRSIRQEVSPPAMSRRGRRRRLLAWVKAGGLTLTVALAGWGGYALVHSWATDRAALATAVHSAPVRETVLITDGVLGQKWVTDMLALPRGASLMALDLPALRDRLLAHGQIRVAVLTRSFPDTLVVTLQERTPVARIQASDEPGRVTQLLVAKDGVAYEGLGYDRQLLASLPWLDGVRLVRDGRGYAPIPGMADVAALLSTAQLQAPHLYRNWLIVSLARLESADEILVKAQDVPQVVFSRKRDFYKQVARLDYVLDAALMLPEAAGLQSVNLTLEGQVPVRLSGAPGEPERAVEEAPRFSLQPPSQRRKQRDL